MQAVIGLDAKFFRHFRLSGMFNMKETVGQGPDGQGLRFWTGGGVSATSKKMM